MEIEILCNTEDDILFRNIEINSRRALEWIAEVPAHDEHAVIVGGGPSLVDSLDAIRWRQSLGQKIFALNGAATFLQSHGIKVDFLVILDARRENLTFQSVNGIGESLIASQCHPDLFSVDTSSKIRLWHPKIEGIESYLPDERESLTLIGGGTTVGLSAMCLAYTMGYRKLHLFGYDSSHSECRNFYEWGKSVHIESESHAYSQPMNANEPMCKVTVFGKTFKSSLAMAKQAELFPTVCDNLIDLGCTITVDGDGLLPFMTREIARIKNSPAPTEQEKYTAMWGFPQYRSVAPGEQVAQQFVDIAGVTKDHVIVDFGCGTGRGAKKVHELTGCEFILIDFAENSLDADIAQETWFTRLRHDLTQPLAMSAKIGFCTDVMEHIPPDYVRAVICNIMRAADKVFFQIGLVEDNCGALIGHPLHLSIHETNWWADLFIGTGYGIEYIEGQGNSAIFYVTH